VSLHQVVGFEQVGICHGVGYKLGRWHDVGSWQLSLQPESAEPPSPRAIHEIRDSRAVLEALTAGVVLVKVDN
jgi:phosphinothricin acetyltransferase